MLVGARNIGIGVRLSCSRSQWTFLIARSFVSILKFPGNAGMATICLCGRFIVVRYARNMTYLTQNPKDSPRYGRNGTRRLMV